VITGLWLGPTADRSTAFAYQVAPRGAAQAVYRDQVRLNIDPALVEQIGPRQYRLRAFPVEPRRWVADSAAPNPGPDLHLWLTYRVLAQGSAWPLPQLAQKFNVFWDGSTTRLVNGQPAAGGTEAWFAPTAPASKPVQPTAHRIDFPGGQSVSARPVTPGGQAASAAGLRLALVLDRSFSMQDHAAEINTILAALKPANPDVYLTASIYRGETPVRTSLASVSSEQLFYFGGQNAAELLVQFQQLQAGQAYDAVLVVTDSNNFELGQSKLTVSVPNAPVWLIHLGGFPLGYDDSTQQALQASGGGVAASLDEALTRLNAARRGAGQYDLLDGYEWQTLPAGQAGGLPLSSGDDAGFAALAARRVILAEMVKNKGALSQLPILDQLHQLAVSSSIVTPYSSMLVLVNERQQSLLDELNKQADRFQREVENVGDTNQVSPNIITGVPEPQEWLLMLLAGAGLIFLLYRRQRQKPAAA
jgi:putative PEP-CTERM system integral membrane protein